MSRSLSGLDDTDMCEIFQGTAALWPELAGTTVLVTGATGWFGTWLLDVLVTANQCHALGMQIFALSRRPELFSQRHPELFVAPGLHWLTGDVTDRHVAAGLDPHYVIHAATNTHVRFNAEDPAQTLTTIVDGTRQALTWAGPRCKGFLLLSSGAVYGPLADNRTAHEESTLSGPDPLNVKSAYAEGKRAAETWCTVAGRRRGVPVRIARCFAFVGPHMPLDAHFAVGNFVRDGLLGGPLVVQGDGRTVRSYLYMSDLVIWLLHLLVRAPVLRAYNVGSPAALSIGMLAEKIAGLCGVKVLIQGERQDPVDRYLPDVTRIGEELGLRQQVSLDVALKRTLHWAARSLPDRSEERLSD
ncbi:MAG: NAD(P)-dependent oxidoreductase [Magnetococcus sp. DMHC-1]|nr:NAD(P)-dependent oxidoreductase [Magnetococcales bacterium]MBF0154344.1 NAD(P)-dependent oxidoreductase [Magnetococcales bacterium]